MPTLLIVAQKPGFEKKPGFLIIGIFDLPTVDRRD